MSDHQVMEPLRELMCTHLTMSGDDWREQSLAEAAVRDSQGLASQRAFRITIMATQELEDKCMGTVGLLMREHVLWSGLPIVALTVERRCLAFRLLSRTGCCIEELLREEHMRCPVVLFKLLDKPERAVADEIKAIPECVRDPWAHRFLSTYADPIAPEPLAVLTTIASLVKADIAEVECRHASIRRHLHSRLQTHGMEFGYLSGQFLAQQVRCRAGEMGLCGSKARRKKVIARHIKPKQAPVREPKKKGGGGGAQRAYISEQLRSRKLSLRTSAAMLGEEFRNLTPEERAKYEERGATATKRWRQDATRQKTAFGLLRRKSRAVKKAKADRRKDFWAKMQSLTDAERLDALVAHTLPPDNTGASYLESLSTARAVAREGAAATRAHSEHLLQQLDAWRSAEAGKAVSLLATALGLPPGREDEIREFMVVEPAEHATIIKYSPDIGKAASSITAALHREKEWHPVRHALEEDLFRSAATHHPHP